MSSRLRLGEYVQQVSSDDETEVCPDAECN